MNLNDAVVEEVVDEGTTLLVPELLALIERGHDPDRPGISRDAVRAYAEAIASQATFSFDSDAFLDEIDEHLVADDSWVGSEALYELDDDRISRYPKRWHERLSGSTDVREYVTFLEEEAPDFEEDLGHGGSSSGIQEDDLVDVIATIGRVGRRSAKAAIEEARERGDVVEDADQHPQASVYLTEEDEAERDQSLDR